MKKIFFLKNHYIYFFFNEGKKVKKIEYKGVYSLFILLFTFCFFLLSYQYFLKKKLVLEKTSFYEQKENVFNLNKLEFKKVILNKEIELYENKDLYSFIFDEMKLRFKEEELIKVNDDSEIDIILKNRLNGLKMNSQKYFRSVEGMSFLNYLKLKLDGQIPTGWPLTDQFKMVTSSYGIRFSPFERANIYHVGVDLGAPKDYPILASASGRVTFAGYKGNLGFFIIIKHQNYYETRYAHIGKILVSAGQRVKKGEMIGRVGLSGRTTGYHLHFEIRHKGKTVNPLPYIDNRL